MYEIIIVSMYSCGIIFEREAADGKYLCVNLIVK